MKRERVDALLHSSYLGRRYVIRVSNQTIKLRANRVPDSDALMLEDRYGYRYIRSTYPTQEWLYFEMI